MHPVIIQSRTSYVGNHRYLAFLLTFVLSFSSTYSFSKETPRPSYFNIGYSFVSKSYNNAYSLYTSPSLPTDLSSMEMLKDHMLYSNWKFAYGYNDFKNVYCEMDFTSLIYVIYAAINPSASEKPNNMWGVGEMQNFGKQTTSGAVAYGYDINLFSGEATFGAKGITVGPYLGFSMIGIGDTSGLDPIYANGQDVLMHMNKNVVSHFGLGLHFTTDMWRENFIVQPSFRVNKLGVLGGDTAILTKGEKRKGIEIYPSVKIFPSGDFGPSIEISYKLQQWKPFSTTDKWSGTLPLSSGTLPNMTNHLVSITLGARMCFDNSGKKEPWRWRKRHPPPSQR